MIGTVEEATFILDWQINKGDLAYSNIVAPEGWRYLGSGCYRTAYLAPSGVVYKVQRWYRGYISQSNEQEWATYRTYFYLKHPEGCRLPKMSYFKLAGGGVIAMERFKSTIARARYASYDRQVQRLKSFCFNLYDLHHDNIGVTEDDKVAIIDFGG